MKCLFDVHSVQAGAWVMEAEQGGYYKLCRLGVWMEFYAATEAGLGLGARWTIDRWDSHHDASAFLKRRVTTEEGCWRIEIIDVITTGWRDGSIGGPNAEQPSASRWILWGKDKDSVKCLPLGNLPPRFEFALYLKRQGAVDWQNNQGHNFALSLDNVC